MLLLSLPMLSFFLRTDVHKYFVLQAFARVRGKTRAVFWVEGVDCLDKTYCAYGNKVLLAVACGIIKAVGRQAMSLKGAFYYGNR